jgi:hypothetical protein
VPLHSGDGPHAKIHAALGFGWFVLWFVFLGMSAADSDWGMIGWCFYMFMVPHIAYLCSMMRAAHNIYGSSWEDLLGALVMYPNTLSQLDFQVVDCTTSIP